MDDTRRENRLRETLAALTPQELGYLVAREAYARGRSGLSGEDLESHGLAPSRRKVKRGW